jgi:cob(I)alamin adenosyltransferase
MAAMRERLNRITTRSGDDGSTGLADGQRLPKDHPRVAALGEVDELNSTLGLLLAEPTPQAVPAALRTLLERVQHELFDLGAELSLPGQAVLGEDRVSALETDLQQLNAGLPALKEFILPGGTRAAALAHVCRCQARRAERSLVQLMHLEPQRTTDTARHYLNRLSDLLFVAARVLNGAGEDASREVYWRSARLRAED